MKRPRGRPTRAGRTAAGRWMRSITFGLKAPVAHFGLVLGLVLDRDKTCRWPWLRRCLPRVPWQLPPSRCCSSSASRRARGPRRSRALSRSQDHPRSRRRAPCSPSSKPGSGKRVAPCRRRQTSSARRPSQASCSQRRWQQRSALPSAGRRRSWTRAPPALRRSMREPLAVAAAAAACGGSSGLEGAADATGADEEAAPGAGSDFGTAGDRQEAKRGTPRGSATDHRAPLFRDRHSSSTA